MSTAPNSHIPLRSPTPPLDSSSDDLNELSLDQELAQLERPHFLDYTAVGIPFPVVNADQPPPIPPRQPLTNSLPLNRRSSIPVKMIRSADNVPSYSETSTAAATSSSSGKKHFLDENPIRPDYDYNRPHRSLDRQYERRGERDDNGAIKMPFEMQRQHSADRQKPKKMKEPSYALSRFLENDDESLNQYNDNEVQLSDVNLCANPSEFVDNLISGDYMYSLLSMIGCNNTVDMSKKFLELSKSPNTCASLRHSRCIPILVQMIDCGKDDLTRKQAREALRNVVNYHTDDKVGRREAKVLRYIEQVMDYGDSLKKFKEGETDSKPTLSLDSDNHPLQAMCSLMKISFDEEHRHSMCTLGALQTIANLVYYDSAVHGTNPSDAKCISFRRYAGMALTNLTFGDGNNKALLCANHDFMRALVAQIDTDADDLLQVTANVLRNLSWRADPNMKSALNEIGTVTALTLAAMKNENKESTLRAILSALWNLSAHCSKNKAEFCMVDGALAFLVKMLKHKSDIRTLPIIENAGGILRNVSSHIAVNEDYRKILRQGDCLAILLVQLKSESLTVVSNACGTLWNLSARCPEDQKFLRDNGAISMLRSLIHSKHKMISNGSKVALKNLINFRGEMNRSGLDPVAKSMGLKELPTLSARKQRALEVELDENLSETCENVETTKTPPPTVNHKAPKSFTALDRSHHYSVERNFEQLSLQCNVREPSDHSQSASLIWDPKPYQTNVTTVFTMSAAPPHPTGTIPKRTMQADPSATANATAVPDVIASTSNASNPGDSRKDETIDSDQITNFSLVYCEEGRDAKAQKNRTFSVAEEDTVKCYESEGTPHLSTATSINDLRPLPKHSAHSHNMHRNSKSGRTTTENSGINTPERPINYCEEGTPAYFSRRDSFSSLHELIHEEVNEPYEITHKPNQLDILPAHKTDANELNAQNQPIEQASNLDSSRPDYEHNSSDNCTVPTTPGESASKTVTFNEFNLETPMMFSRHSSLGSLASHEPPLNDDIGSVVSETSRMPSGIISPSEIPDSPSQTMPQSPRQKHTNSHGNSSNPRHLPFDDEVRTFGVENTPALISTATSLSNLSLDDEPKIANDLLIKEMRLMHHPSDDQDDDPNAIASTSAETNGENANFNRMETLNCDAGHSDSDDNDDESLLNNCISIGIQAKNIEPDIKSPPALPEPADILPDLDDDLDGDDPVDLLEQCIRSGITKKANKAPSESSGIQLSNMGCKPASRQMIKENPIGMLRKGGNAFIETNYDETNRFDIEDSPCNFSVASGLSDLTVGSNPVGLLKINRLPSIQSIENDEADPNLNEDRPLSPLSVNSEEERQLLQQAFAAGQARILSQKQANATPTHNSNVAAAVNRNDDDGHDSISSIDSNDSNELLQQCIMVGMTKANQNVQPKSQTQAQTAMKSPPKPVNSNQMRKSQLPTPKASTSQLVSAQSASIHRSRATKRDQDDKQLLMDCINAGIERNIRSKSTVNEKSMPNSPSKRIESEQMRSMPPSKNVKTTSATVYHTAGATDVVDNRRGTACVQGQRQRQPAVSTTTTTITNRYTNISTAQTMKSKIVHDQSIHITGDIIAITMTQPTTTTATHETGYNNSALNSSMLSTKSHNSFNMGGDLSLLERSNEYPACLGQNESIYDSQHSSSVDMEISNECLFEHQSPPKIDKHKDPNLMLQSVERLTHELVSTAEYLRTTNSNDCDDDVTITDSKITFSNSNNTWNEDTNPNAVPFPSMSRTAPVVDSMHDDDTTISELNCEGSRYEMANSEFIEDSTPTNNNRTFSESIPNKKSDTNGLHFEIGGKVNPHAAEMYSCNGYNSNSTTSTMTNSTIIAMEADKIRNQLIKDNKSDSTISLDKIRPPSVMEKMNHSSYCDSLTAGASSLNRSPARFLAQGFMARRALQSAANNGVLGSTDSINSSCNLDRVKPPSIMDDLLDSMISVDSIASEYMDNPPPPQPNNEDPSNYETALSECDDLTVTLKNCADLPYDNTPCSSDFSSVESTPKKGRRSLTPRRKRQLTKERYQTYTIATNDSDGQHSQENLENGSSDGRGIFAMQLSNNPIFMNGNDSDAISLVSSDGEVSSLRAFTKNLPYLNDISVHHNDISINTNTYTKLPRGSIQNSLQSTPMPSGDFYDSLPIDNGGTSNANSKPSSPSRTITKSPRIVKPSPANSTVAAEKPEASVQLEAEAKVIRGRKKPAYVSPYSIAKLTKTTTTPAQPKPLAKAVVTPKVVAPPKPASMSKTVENKAKSFIQRSAESLKKMRPTFTSKLMKQSPTKKSLDRQKSSDSAKSSETLVRQGTFIKDEPSAGGDIPVIASEPTSPKKTKTLVSKIPFNRATSLQTTRNVTKSNTNIEIPLQKNASATFIRRTMKSASSTSQISSPRQYGSLSPRQSLDSPSTSKSIFNRWSPPNKKVSPVPATAAKVSTLKPVSRESIGSPVGATSKPISKAGVKVATNNPSSMPNKVSKIGGIRGMARTTKV